MKNKIIFALGLFLVIIGIWSFSWATTDVLIVDTSVCGSSLGDIDCTEDIELNNSELDVEILTYCLIYLSTYNGSTYLNIYFSEDPFVYDSTRNVITAEWGCYGLEYNDSNGQLTGTMGFDAEDYTTDFCYSYSAENNIVVSNAIFSNTSYNEFFYNETTILNSTFFNNAENYGDTVPNYNGGGGNQPSVEYYEPIVMIDDMNFKKSFKFNFQIEQIRSDTKYYIFLKNYIRNSYSSVTGQFVVLTVTTPTGYNYSNYYNYLYYDDFNNEISLPAGCEIHIYTGSGNNNSTISLSEVTIGNNNIIPHYNLGSLTNLYYNDVNTHILFSTYTYNDLIPTSYTISSNSIGKVVTSILNALELKVNMSDNSALSFNIIDTFLPFLSNNTLTSEEFRKSYYLQALYYGIDKYTNNIDFNNAMNIIKNYNNFICGSFSIISYENSKFDTAFGVPYYSLYRSTKIYNCENQVNQNFYRFQYTDKQDVSSLLPSGVSVDYLTSPFYQNNNNSSSGGYITYNITQILNGTNPINYGINESPLNINPQEDYISNDDDTDGQLLDDNSTQQIDNTSSDNFLRGIYQAVMRIQDLLSKQAITTQNYTTNITYNIEQNFKYFFLPQERFL